MTETSAETLCVTVEREIAFPPEKIWRALTQPHLLEEWLMKSDFKPVVGHQFDFRGDWGSVGCRGRGGRAEQDAVLHVGGPGLESVVTWTLVPSGAGTRLRMEQSGFRPDQQQAYRGRPGRVVAVLCKPGAAPGGSGLKFVRPPEGAITRSSH